MTQTELPHLTPNQAKLMMALSPNKSMTVEELWDVTGIADIYSVYKGLKIMREKGIVDCTGRPLRYHLVNEWEK